MGDEDGKARAKKDKGKAKPPNLPADAPQDVKDFVDCKSDSITLDPTKKGFLPEIPLIGAPNVTIEAVAGKPGTVKISLKKAPLLDTSFTVTVKDGHLDADTTGVTPQLVKDALDKWLKRYNDWLDANNRKLDGITVDKGKATIKKVALAGAGGAGKAVEGKGGSGVKKAVGFAAGALIVGTSAYLGIHALGPSGPSGPPGPPAANDGGVGSSTGTGLYTCDEAAKCGTTYDALFQGVGVAVTHNGGPGGAKSKAQVVGVTAWDDFIKITANCAFGPTTGQARPDAQGVFRIDLPLDAYGPCEIVDLKLKTGTTFSDGFPIDALDVTSFDVTPTPTQIDQDSLEQAVDDLSMLSPGAAVDAQVVVDVVTGTVTCLTNSLFSDAAVRQDFAVLCGPDQPAYGLQFGIPTLDPAFPGLLTAGGVEISGFDKAALAELFGPGGPLHCGVGDIGVTICPEGAVDGVLDGPFDGAMLFQGLVPAQADDPLTFDLGGGNTVSVKANGADSTVDVSGSVQPYVVVRNQAISVLLPGQEPGPFNLADGPDLTPWPAVPYGQATSGSGGPPDKQAVRDFATQLAESLASDDKDFAVGHLDPAVLQVFPTQCPAHFAALDDPTYDIQVIRLGATGTYNYAPPSAGGTSVDVPQVLSVTVDLTDAGNTRRTKVHFGSRADGLTWFADCGAPP